MYYCVGFYFFSLFLFIIFVLSLFCVSRCLLASVVGIVAVVVVVSILPSCVAIVEENVVIV